MWLTNVPFLTELIYFLANYVLINGRRTCSGSYNERLSFTQSDGFLAFSQFRNHYFLTTDVFNCKYVVFPVRKSSCQRFCNYGCYLFLFIVLGRKNIAKSMIWQYFVRKYQTKSSSYVQNEQQYITTSPAI